MYYDLISIFLQFTYFIYCNFYQLIDDAAFDVKLGLAKEKEIIVN
jgi:hypothetical protein